MVKITTLDPNTRIITPECRYLGRGCSGSSDPTYRAIHCQYGNGCGCDTKAMLDSIAEKTREMQTINHLQ